jgi:hypothetical protein
MVALSEFPLPVHGDKKILIFFNISLFTCEFYDVENT